MGRRLMLLAIDTSGGTVVALLDPVSGALAVRELDNPRRHAEAIGPFLGEVLSELGAPASAVEVVVAGMGPGPFTGLRIGIAAARAFAAARSLPLVPLVSHDAIALELLQAQPAGATDELLVTTDARRGELFASRYTGLDDAGLPVRSRGPELLRPEQLQPELQPGALDAGRSCSAPPPQAEQHSAHRPVSGAALARLGLLLHRHGRPGPAQALYLRSPDVTLSPAKGVTG